MIINRFLKFSIHKPLIIAILFSIFFLSCEKAIIDLNEENPKLTIEAVITDQDEPFFVYLTKTTGYNTLSDSLPKVSKATVYIQDDKGNSEFLSEIKPGVYKASTTKGVCGRTYTLTVYCEGKNYSATSYLQHPVEIDSVVPISVKDSEYGMKNQTNKYQLKCYFKDPKGVTNFYRFDAVSKKDSSELYYQIFKDDVSDGKEIEVPIHKQKYNQGDEVTVLLMNINSEIYDYYKTANNILKSRKGPISSSSNANPVTNIKGDALGYFAAFSVKKKTIVIHGNE